jgi:transposase
MQNFVRQHFEIELSKSTMTKYFKDLGLTYKPVKTKKET